MLSEYYHFKTVSYPNVIHNGTALIQTMSSQIPMTVLLTTSLYVKVDNVKYIPESLLLVAYYNKSGFPDTG